MMKFEGHFMTWIKDKETLYLNLVLMQYIDISYFFVIESLKKQFRTQSPAFVVNVFVFVEHALLS